MAVLRVRGRRSPTVTVTAVITAGLILLGGAVGLGLRWPNSWFGSGPADSADFDYSALAASLGRLSDEYLRSIFGGSFTGTLAGSPDATGNRRVRSKAMPVDVTHPFTNDDFENAYQISSLPFRANTNTTGATRRSGEPADCLPAGGTAWYHYTPPSDVALFADTFGTSGEAALGVYKGNSLRSLSPEGCDHNVLGNAQVGFRASAGQTYYFQITSLRGGPTVLELAAVGPTTLETVSASGGRPDGHAPPLNNRGDVSADGRFVAFISKARNLAATRSECGLEVCISLYLRDRWSGETALIVATAAGPDETPTPLWHPALSPDGRYVGFTHYEFPIPGFHGPINEAGQVAANAYLYDRLSGSLELVSRNSNGEPARAQPGSDGTTVRGAAGRGSGAPSISADGRYVTFYSDGANLGGHVERGNAINVYRRDRVTGITRLVSTDSEGRPMRANSWACTGRNLSGDGRYVFFASTFGTGQQTGDAGHGTHHLYLWDASTGRTRLVTKLPEGVQTKGNYCPAISLDGSRTAFVSRDALVSEDTNETPDVYAYDVATGRLTRVSVTSAGEQTKDLNYFSTESSGVLPRSVTLSADGRYVAFDSSASELTPSSTGSTRYAGPGTPGPIQVYIHDILTRSTVLASVSSTGEPLPGNSVVPYISNDGTKVSFMNSSYWTDQNSATKLDVFVHELR